MKSIVSIGMSALIFATNAQAENPFLGRTDVVQSGMNAGEPVERTDAQPVNVRGQSMFGAPRGSMADLERRPIRAHSTRPDWAGR